MVILLSAKLYSIILILTHSNPSKPCERKETFQERVFLRVSNLSLMTDPSDEKVYTR